MSGKCPQCHQYVTQAEAYDVQLTVNFQPQWKGLAYRCPNANCQTILGVQMNPLELENGLVTRIGRMIQQLLGR